MEASRKQIITFRVLLLFLMVSYVFPISVTNLRQMFNEAIIVEDDLSRIEAIILDAKDKNKGINYSEQVDVYLTIWEIKLLFLKGEITESKKIFDLLSEKTTNFTRILCQEPYYKQIKGCSENKDCYCDNQESLMNLLDPRFDNIDFLKESHFYNHFTDVGVEIDNGESAPIPIKEIAHAISLTTSERVQLLLDPPNIKISAPKYELGSSKQYILDYYFNKSRKNILIKLEDEFQKGKTQNLEFYKAYEVAVEDSNHYFVFKNIPRTPLSTSIDKNSLYYKMYVKEDGDVTTRYSFNLKEKKSKKKKNIETLTTVLIRWNINWAMQKWMDNSKVFLLFPILYLDDYSNQALFELADIMVTDKKELRNIGAGKSTTNVNLDDFNVKATENSEIIGDESLVRVVKIDYPYVKNGKINLDFTDEYVDEIYQNQSKELKRQRNILIYSVLALFSLLLLM